jgi:hypothetical protein
MQIEIFETNKTPHKTGCTANRGWFWHFRSKGRITADSEAFPTKAHAVRAAKAVVTAVVKQAVGHKPVMVWTQYPEGALTIIEWELG